MKKDYSDIKLSSNISTTPLRQWDFQQCLPFSWTALRGKHCWYPIAVMGDVDTFGLRVAWLLHNPYFEKKTPAAMKLEKNLGTEELKSQIKQTFHLQCLTSNSNFKRSFPEIGLKSSMGIAQAQNSWRKLQLLWNWTSQNAMVNEVNSSLSHWRVQNPDQTNNNFNL